MTRRSAAHHLHAALFELNEALLNDGEQSWTPGEVRAYERAVKGIQQLQRRHGVCRPNIPNDVFLVP